jgi:hypothetical protein
LFLRSSLYFLFFFRYFFPLPLFLSDLLCLMLLTFCIFPSTISSISVSFFLPSSLSFRLPLPSVLQQIAHFCTDTHLYWPVTPKTERLMEGLSKLGVSQAASCHKGT